MEDLQDLVHLLWDALTPTQQAAVANEKLVRGITDLAYDSPAAVAERYRDAVAACVAECYGVRLTPAQAGALVLTDNRLKRQLCVVYGRRPPAGGGFDTDERELIGQALVDYLMPGRPNRSDTLFRDNVWHWPLNGSTAEYVAEFRRRFRAAATAAGVELVEEVWD